MTPPDRPGPVKHYRASGGVPKCGERPPLWRSYCFTTDIEAVTCLGCLRYIRRSADVAIQTLTASPREIRRRARGSE